MHLYLNDSDDQFWPGGLRSPVPTLELPAGVACDETPTHEGDPMWARVLLAVGFVFLGLALIYFTVVVLL